MTPDEERYKHSRTRALREKSVDYLEKLIESFAEAASTPAETELESFLKRMAELEIAAARQALWTKKHKKPE